MLAIKSILFPVDFSERSCGAAPFVQALASRFGSKVTVMSVMYPFWRTGLGDPMTAAAGVALDTDELKRDLEARLSSAFVNELAGIPVDRVVEIGEPADVITRFAQAEGVDLIMMPTHGYGPFRTLLLGSITAKVLHDAECPVWTATHIDEPPARDHLACRNVLCAIDGTPKSAPLMEWAARF
ncbi:MAG TPA: universal stress protein, partial [Bryobacteraceae bacterium]